MYLMEETSQQTQTSNGNQSAQNSRGLVLVVEDDSFLGKLLCDRLRTDGFEIYQATTGQQALDFLKDHSPMLMLLDLLLPVMDGFQVLEWVRRQDRIKDLPVIVLSNVREPNMVERAQQLGADDYLIKAHFVLDEIIERMNQVIKKRYM